MSGRKRVSTGIQLGHPAELFAAGEKRGLGHGISQFFSYTYKNNQKKDSVQLEIVLGLLYGELRLQA
jgi:hypothetical protein